MFPAIVSFSVMSCRFLLIYLFASESVDYLNIAMSNDEEEDVATTRSRKSGPRRINKVFAFAE